MAKRPLPKSVGQVASTFQLARNTGLFRPGAEFALAFKLPSKPKPTKGKRK